MRRVRCWLSSPQREPGRALSRLDISEMRAGATLYYDQALEVRCSLLAATLEDVRPASTLALRKIFQSYSGDNQVMGAGITGISISMPPMVDVTYKQTGNGDAAVSIDPTQIGMAVDVVVEKTRLNVSVPYILTLVRFVGDALPSPSPPPTARAATASSHRRLPSDSTSGYHSTASEPDMRGLSISAVLKKPEVILFADPTDVASQVVVLKMDVLFDYSRNLGQENFVTSITGLHLLSCSYGHRKQTMTTVRQVWQQVLDQCDVEMSRSHRLSEDEVRANVSFSSLHLTLSPSIIHTLTDVATDLTEHIKVDIFLPALLWNNGGFQEATTPTDEELPGGSKPEPVGLWAPERIASSKWLDNSVSESLRTFSSGCTSSSLSHLSTTRHNKTADNLNKYCHVENQERQTSG
ncbi:hypothetical protein LAZ67_2003682 [Cordylochernes scorpioides]|uniref:VPS13-like middle region domain-containing protein n=1 Tax=Cordylochernes scorpioides TaxID=51811 RepID=A0ABY6K4T4_9ARAC|nr:hypothetical protein LAZ67_2003682 [Cordylochernes scorpioides]